MNGSVHFIRNLRKVTGRNKKLVFFYSTKSEEIVIPKRIERGPTDILRAIASTINRDPLAAHYKYHDDPYLIPYSNAYKRRYSLSYESGKKAAYWIRQEHSDLFHHKVAEPSIGAFYPRPVITETSIVNVTDLNKAVETFCVSDAITIYNLLKGENIDTELKQNLLELLCYFNCENDVNDEWLEQRWYEKRVKEIEKVKNVWKDNCIAENLFTSIKSPNFRSYSAIITGMAIHGQMDQAMKFYEQSKTDKIPLTVEAYNALLSRMMFISESQYIVWENILKFLIEMKQNNVKPDIYTLNSILETLSSSNVNKLAKVNSIKILSEFKRISIEPCLTTYFYLLNIFYPNKRASNNLLYKIMDEIENKELKVIDKKDTHFFYRAMEVCRHNLHDTNLARKIDKLLHVADNYNLIGNSYKESHYYRYFFCTLLEVEPFQEFMKIYDKLVPHIYTPEFTVMEEVLEILSLNDAVEYIPKLWSDVVLFGLLDRESIIAKILLALKQNKNADFNEKSEQIAWSIWEKIEKTNEERPNTIQYTGGILSDMIAIFLKANAKSKTYLVLDKLIRLRNQISGDPEISTLRLFFETCVQDKSIDLALKCLRYCKDMEFFETEEFAATIAQLELTEAQKHQLNSIIIVKKEK